MCGSALTTDRRVPPAPGCPFEAPVSQSAVPSPPLRVPACAGTLESVSAASGGDLKEGRRRIRWGARSVPDLPGSRRRRSGHVRRVARTNKHAGLGGNHLSNTAAGALQKRQILWHIQLYSRIRQLYSPI